MSRLPPLENRTVLVTGAARGLGRELALELAIAEKADLVLVDRNAAGLRELAGEISGSCSSRVLAIARDLLAEDAPRKLHEELAEVPVFGLINNAGLTYYGETRVCELPKLTAIIELDFRVVVELSVLFLSRFRRAGEGFILNVTSLAAFLPIPYQAVYAAAKAAAQNFSECLGAENRGSRVLIATFAPSGLATDMVREAGLSGQMERHRYSCLTPQCAARAALDGLKRGRRVIVPGLYNRFLYALLQVSPRSLQLAAAKAIYRPDKCSSDASGPDHRG
jgi:short-subunit dehydrogenase